jgi:hypothetical protein
MKSTRAPSELATALEHARNAQRRGRAAGKAQLLGGKRKLAEPFPIRRVEKDSGARKLAHRECG